MIIQRQSPDAMSALAEEQMECGTPDDGFAALLAKHERRFPDGAPGTVDFHEAELLRRAIDDPSSWAHDPALAEAFDSLNRRHFEGRVRPHRLVWFDVSMLPDEEAISRHMWARLAYLTFGYRTDGDLGRWISVNARLKLAPRKLAEVLRHEMTHDVVEEQGHGPEFVRALRRQGPGEAWVEEEARRYAWRARVDETVRRAMIREWRPGDGPDRDLAEVRRAIGRAGLATEELNRSLETLSPAARTLVLRAVTLDVGAVLERS